MGEIGCFKQKYDISGTVPYVRTSMTGNLYFFGSKLATIIQALHARWRRLTNNRIDIFGGIKMDLQSLQPSQGIDEVICQGNITFCQVPPFERSFIILLVGNI